MAPNDLSRRTIRFVNVAHAADHFVLLIYPTAVIAIGPDLGLDYGALIGLSTGAFLAFGLFSLPMGWLSEKFGRRNLLATFFLGCGASLIALSFATTALAFGALLFVLGVFSAIYHPIGSAMLVSHTDQLGRDLGRNGVWGNLGAGLASGVTALIAAWLGWRAAFAAPGLVCLAAGVAFLAMVPHDGEDRSAARAPQTAPGAGRPALLLALFAAIIIAGGMTFNVTTISLPKALDERLGFDLPLALLGSLATAVFVFGALTQLTVGRLLDTKPLPLIFLGLASVQACGLAIAALSVGVPLVAGLAMAMAGIYGQVVVNDAMVARYVPAHVRAKAYSVRYFLGFTASGFAAPFIAWTHGIGGFPATLAAAAAIAAVILACAAAFYGVARAAPAPLPAE
ncbi:MFS transporter [Chenggangzhangella methanolivorans]|uniref:MFS transporter n=1 Tax=Chenggangzhangella methanolivorans TaxID=1437009 RepID=A0A9E6UP89_9HYPH|nr:MFS transporter [Chenggangzhangella methanolivorans]QZO01144.1 MFS transporter [Chenggangzhangella methanolivorans]